MTDHERIVEAVCAAARSELDALQAVMSRIDGRLDGAPAPGPFGAGGSSPEIGDLMSALAKAQGAMAPVVKDAKNPHFRSSYATLASAVAAARDALSANGLAVMQSVEAFDGSQMLSCVTVLAHGSQWVRTCTTIPIAKKDAQGIGSAATYARRYGLLAILGLAPEDDDDGNAAVHRPKPRTTAPRSKSPQAEMVERAGKALDFSAQIREAATVSELEDLAVAIKDLPAAQREHLRTTYTERLTALRGGAR